MDRASLSFDKERRTLFYFFIILSAIKRLNYVSKSTITLCDFSGFTLADSILKCVVQKAHSSLESKRYKLYRPKG